MAIEIRGENVLVLCRSNGCIKNGPDGVYLEGSTLKKFRVKRKTKLSRLLEGIYLTFGLDKQRSKFEIFGRYPVLVSPNRFWYLLFPVVSDSILETMLEVPNNHPSIHIVELYLELKSTYASDDVIDYPAASSSKRQRTQTHGCSNKGVSSGVLKPCLLPTLWIDDDHDMHLGLRFKDRDELKKAVDWWSIRRRRKCVVRETDKDVYRFECVRSKCKWSICAARMEQHEGCFEIIKCSAPHTCCPEDYESEFVADEIERVVRVQPTLSIAELNQWWKESFGYKLETSKMRDGKLEVIKRVFGDEDQCFRVIPKLMAAFRSSNGLLVDWRYDLFPNPEFASFCGLFWAFSQCIGGFQHCRPVIIVDTRNLNGEYQLKLMIASGVDAANKNFPLAFAVTKEVSTDTWRWFLNGIRDKVTQRKGVCLISIPHPDILAVINEPGSRWQEPWAYHRFCLNHLRNQFYDIFENGELECLVEKAGYSCQKNEFDSYMNDIKEKNPEARRWLDKILPNQWSQAHDGGRRYGIMEIDPEALFAVCRGFPYYTVATSGVVVLMFGELRDAFDESFTCSRYSLNRGDVYTKPVMDKLEDFMTDSATYVIMSFERDAFEVSESTGKEERIVQLNDSFCTCEEFQAYKFPCLHALALCDMLKINPLEYADDC